MNPSLEEDPDDKRDLFTSSSTPHYAQDPFVPSSLPPGYLIRLRRLSVRLGRKLRWLIGPAQPLSPDLLPRPTPSTSFSITCLTRKTTTLVDPEISCLTRARKLKRGLIPFLALWFMVFVLLIREQWYAPGAPEIIGCTAQVFPDWPAEVCGLNGTDCAENLLGGSSSYRCLGGCRDVTLGNPRWVGEEEVDGVPLIIGGGNGSAYRADTWVCPAAIHSSLITPILGGCVTLNPIPFLFGSSSFISSSSNGLTSTAFAPHFPGAYTLTSYRQSGCLDLHPIVSTVNAICLFIFTLFLSPPDWLLFPLLLTLGYLQIVLFSDVRYIPPDWSSILQGVPPVIFAGYWIWKVSFERTLNGFKQLPFDKAFWQGAGFWIGIESSSIFAKLPIQRLGYDRLDKAGIVTLTAILVAVVIVVGIQAYSMRKYGLLQYYIIRYIPLGILLLVLACIPGYYLRLHHYLLALFALPVLSLPNRISLFGQAFFLGLFLDGIGRWGWASILQTQAQLLGDAQAGTPLPVFLPLNETSPGTIAWEGLSQDLVDYGVGGWEVLVDDILRLTNYTNTSYTLSDFGLKDTIQHYFRLAYVVNGTTMDWTDPITRWVNTTT